MQRIASPVRAMLFDFDGVLADTEPYHWRAWREVVRPFGIDLDWETFERTCIGVSDLAMLNGLCALSTNNVTPAELRAQYPLKRKVFRELVNGRPLIARELVELLKSLTDRLLGVVTSSNQTEIQPILLNTGVLESLTIVIYGNNVRNYKPHPEPYLLAVQGLGVDPRETLVFEDSEAGMQSARKAGCRVVRVDSVPRVPELIRASLPEIFPQS